MKLLSFYSLAQRWGGLAYVPPFINKLLNLGSYCGITPNRLLPAVKIRIMFKGKTVFIVVDFSDIPGLFDYPKHLPIPKIGEEIYLDEKSGIVKTIKHVTSGNVTEIKIMCSRI